MDIPVIDPKEIPMVVQGDDDWRGRLDVLREEYPYFRVGDDPTVWFTRYDAAREMFINGELFWEGAFGQHGDVYGGSSLSAWDSKSAEEGMKRHVVVRQALMHVFGPQQVKVWEGAMQSVAGELIDRFAGRGHCEYIHDFSHLYFPMIGADMLGAPRKDWDQLCEWEHAAFKVPVESDSKLLDLNNPAMFQIVEYILKLMDEKRRNPDDRFATWVVQQEDAGVLTADEARWAMQIFVLGSGHTVAAHLGYVFRYLCDHPELQARLVAEPESANSICEELLRLYALGGHTRTVTEDTVFQGVPLKRGDRVYINYSMVNRDPRGPEFDRIDFDRKVNKHLAFNQGWRQCLGLFFARRARNIAVTEWHKRIPRYELDRSKPLIEQVYAGVGFHALPMKWDVR